MLQIDFDILEDFCLIFGLLPALGVEAGVDDTIHVQVHVVDLESIGIGLRPWNL